MHVTPIFHATIILQIILEFVLFISSTPLNPNPVKHFRVRFTAKKEGQITPCLKLVRIILETWNLVCKYTHRKICLIWSDVIICRHDVIVNFFWCHISLIKLSDWCKFQVNIFTGSLWIRSIIRKLTRPPFEFYRISLSFNRYRFLAFIISELLREN